MAKRTRNTTSALIILFSLLIGANGQAFTDVLNYLSNPIISQTTSRAAELANGLRDYTDNNAYNVSDTCVNHTELWFQHVTNGSQWALRMIDAMGKPHSELLNFQMNWLGSYDECVETKALVYADTAAGAGPTSPFKGKYCRATHRLPKPDMAEYAAMPDDQLALTFGICVPSTCTTEDASGLVSVLMSLIPLNMTSLPPATTVCQEDSLEYTTKAIAVITVGAVFVAVIIAATAYDMVVCLYINGTKKQEPETKRPKQLSLSKHGYDLSNSLPVCNSPDTQDIPTVSNGDFGQVNMAYNNTGDEKPGAPVVDVFPLVKEKPYDKPTPYKPGLLGKVLVSFSVYTNVPKILSTHQPKGVLSAVNGIRFISLVWVILGHSFTGAIRVFEQNMMYLFPKLYDRFTFEGIGNSTFSVDSFFTLAGLLGAYLSLKEMKKLGGAKNFKWGMYYFHRFWRLTPPYMLVLMIYVPTIKYWSNGPLWSQTGIERDECEDSWWKNLLYINNLIKAREMCMGHSWYLANDMQFFVISPVLLIPLYYSKLWGTMCCLSLLVGSALTTGVLSSANDLSSNVFFGTADPNMQNYIYMKPWCRVGPYVVGFYTGYLLYKTECKINMPKIYNAIGWTAATAAGLAVVYGLFDPDTTGPDLTRPVSALYNATSRSVWGACLCWVVFACATGYGGPVNVLLSWRPFIPLGRLSYCAYLVHPLVQATYHMSRRTLIYYTDIEISYLFLGHTCISYAVALLVSLAFEAPMMGLEKALLGRGKHS